MKDRGRARSRESARSRNAVSRRRSRPTVGYFSDRAWALLCRWTLALLALQTIAGADEFVGSASCMRCHEKEAALWRDSPHGRHAIAVATPEGGADAAIGSRWMQAYLKRDAAGYHRILPRAFDLRKKHWRDVREVLDEIRGVGAKSETSAVDRRFERDCAGCHASQTRAGVDLSTGRVTVGWTELAINCETCHGPGRAHSDSWQRLEPPKEMARLDRLSPRAATAVCARCHGGPQTDGDFGPEDAPHFVGEIIDRDGFFPDGAASGQLYQYAGFVRSRCHLEGGLACTDCHDSHGPGMRRREHADAICTRCHEEQASRKHTFHDPRQDGARCVACHMPRLLTGIMAHQRDHRIASPLPASPYAPDACTACHTKKTKPWADAAYRKRWGKPPRATLQAIEAIALARKGDDRAKPLLRRALRHPDPFFRANAAFYLREPDPIREDSLPEVRLVAVSASDDPSWALNDPSPRVRAAAQLAALRRGARVTTAMEPTLETAARHLRGLVEARLLLGDAELYAHPDVAANYFAGALVIAPDLPEAWIGLSTSCTQAGRPAAARRILETALKTVAPGPNRERIRALLERKTR